MCLTLLTKREYLDIITKHIPCIMEIIDNIDFHDERKRKYSDKKILKIVVLL